MKVYRKDIIGKIKYREGLIPLSYSNHAKQRLRERVDGELIVAPTVVRVTENNLSSGETKDGHRLTEACIRLDYKKDKWMFLVVRLGSGLVKTLWINDKKARKLRKEVGNVQEHLEEEAPQIRSKWNLFRRLYKKLFFRSRTSKEQIPTV